VGAKGGVLVLRVTLGDFESLAAARALDGAASETSLMPNSAQRIDLLGLIHRLGADAALEMGLIAEIDSDAFAGATKIAQHIAEQPPQAIINTKALLKARNHESVAAVMKAEFEIFAMALQSDEAMEAFMKFMAKKGKS
jgi:enoyl-CoA hydratase/carnithine racemase